MTPNLTVISFYTPNWEYPTHAERLRQECRRLRLNHVIEQRTTTGSYLRNCCLKPGFISECMASFSGPLLWVDVDASIFHVPTFFQSLPPSTDIAAKQRADTSDLVWHVGTIWFQNNNTTREFVDTWRSIGTSTDERSFNVTCAKMKDRLNIADIPPAYFQIQQRSAPVLPETVILHRISSSPEKLSEKRKK